MQAAVAARRVLPGQGWTNTKNNLEYEKAATDLPVHARPAKVTLSSVREGREIASRLHDTSSEMDTFLTIGSQLR